MMRFRPPHRQVTLVTLLAVAAILCAPSVTAAAVVPPASDPFYGSWMSHLQPFIRNLTLLDLSLPGTHDTMTFDLSTTVADNANDLPDDVAALLHEFHTELQWLEIGNFMRNQSLTQGLTVVQQLDAGIRFLDFRTIYTEAPSSDNSTTYDWYGLHFVQSISPSMLWLQDVKAWLDAHPGEIVVMWISKHGNNCGTEYNGVPKDAMHAYWKKIQELFGALIFNTTQGKPLNETTVGELLDRGQRLVLYLADFDSFTTPGDDRQLAYTDCLVDNEFSTSGTNQTKSVVMSRAAFLNAEAHIANKSKPRNEFYLLSMANDPSDRLFDAAMLRYFSLFFNVTNETDSCSDTFHVPGMDEWCPMHLQDASLLSNYYNQISLNEVAECIADAHHRMMMHLLPPDAEQYHHTAYQRDVYAACAMSLPNAIYIDAVDVNGTIRTGTTIYGPPYGNDSWTDSGHDGHGLTGYGYVDTFLLVNVRRGCANPSSSSVMQECAAMMTALVERWSSRKMTRWDDASYGRLSNWPNV